MTKKQKILTFLVILPIILVPIYNRLFEYSGNFFEDFQNHFKIGFILVSAASSFWLINISKKEKNTQWLIFSTTVLVLLLIYIYLATSIIGISFP